jgi:hypothetical protein
MAEMESSSSSANTAGSVHPSVSAQRFDKDVLDVLKDLQLNQKELQLNQKEIIQQISNLQDNQIAILRQMKKMDNLWAIPKHRSHKVPTLRAGQQLTATTELLEMILIQLPYKDILRYIRVNKTFQSTILGSGLIQSWLFFIPETNAPASSSITLNPIMENERFYRRIGLWYDVALDRLCYCDREGRRLLEIESVEITDDKLQGLPVLIVKMKTTSTSTRSWERSRRLCFGSWKRMYLTRQPCVVQWEFTDHIGGFIRKLVSGSIAGLYTVDQFLDALADSIPQHSHRSR